MFAVSAIGSADDVSTRCNDGWSVSNVRRTAGTRATSCQSTRPAKSAGAAAREGYISCRGERTGTVGVCDSYIAACWIIDQNCGRGACYSCSGRVSSLNGGFFVSCQIGVSGV